MAHHQREGDVPFVNDLEMTARQRLSERRFRHVRGVVETARSLAERFGASVHDAETAGWLHDMFREVKEPEMRALFAQAGLALPPGLPQTWHGPLCAARMERDFGVTAGAAVRNAVAWHTLGHPQMDLLAQILYVADAVEPTREYEGVDRLREIAWRDIEEAVAVAADMSIAHLLATRREIALQTVELRNQIWGRGHEVRSSAHAQ